MTIPKTIKWYRIASADTIPLKEGRRVQCGEQTLALFNLGGEYRAVENKCPHKGGPLADGIVAGKTVFCPLHNWRINLENGCALSGGSGQVKTFPVKVTGNQVYIAFDNPQSWSSSNAFIEDQKVDSRFRGNDSNKSGNDRENVND